MTFREKLGKEHPHAIHPMFYGGCKGCPMGYGYTDKKPDYCICGSKEECTKCWDREIPETEEEKKPEVNNIPFDMAKIGEFVRELAKDPNLYISIGIGHGTLNIGITHTSEED